MGVGAGRDPGPWESTLPRTSMHSNPRLKKTERTRAPIGLLLLAFPLVTHSRAQDPASGTHPPKERPNILLCIADDWSHGHSSLDGCPWIATPGFDAVADSGLVFQRAYTPNAKCAPSRACLLTGRNSWQLGDACNHVCPFPDNVKTFVEALAESGYRTGHTAKGWGPGTVGKIDGIRRQLTGPAFNDHLTEPPTNGISPNDYAANFIEFLGATPADDDDATQRPWCFWFGALEPHRGFEAVSGTRIAGRTPADVRHVPAFLPDTEATRQDLLDYATEVEHFDAHVRRMLAELERRGELHNTIVIVTSDHGMPFPRCKGQAYEMSNHIPLAIQWGDGIAHPGRTIDDYVSLIDIAPTLLEAAGVNPSARAMQPITGRSLIPLFLSDRSGQIDSTRDHVLLGKERHDIGRPDDLGYPIRGIVSYDMLYLENFHPERWPAGNPESGYPNCDGSPTKSAILDLRRAGDPTLWRLSFGGRPAHELYDLSEDPDCLVNLADSDVHQRVRFTLARRLATALESQGDPRMLGNAQVFDEIEYTSANMRNFHNRRASGEDLHAGWIRRTDYETERLNLDGSRIPD